MTDTPNLVELLDAIPLSFLILILAMTIGTAILLGEELIHAIGRLRDWNARRLIERDYRIANMGYLEYCDWFERRRARRQIYFGLACLVAFYGLIVYFRWVFGGFWPGE